MPKDQKLLPGPAWLGLGLLYASLWAFLIMQSPLFFIPKNGRFCVLFPLPRMSPIPVPLPDTHPTHFAQWTLQIQHWPCSLCQPWWSPSWVLAHFLYFSFIALITAVIYLCNCLSFSSYSLEFCPGRLCVWFALAHSSVWHMVGT